MKRGICFAVYEDQEEVEEANKSFLGMEALFHLKFGKTSKRKSKNKAAAQNEDTTEQP